ncbi:hypothetical protein MA16_Dca011736 [Dendrobium catenatum]|uniref:Uncharacterized protein n=1 Tax=Dendrobium catenatum TaxID=906689 RepID=A0A2I0WED9_9ASPA|nr:hypothetical protein MA16_Dca011736 [Dendrobium catenatum]
MENRFLTNFVNPLVKMFCKFCLAQRRVCQIVLQKISCSNPLLSSALYKYTLISLSNSLPLRSSRFPSALWLPSLNWVTILAVDAELNLLTRSALISEDYQLTTLLLSSRLPSALWLPSLTRLTILALHAELNPITRSVVVAEDSQFTRSVIDTIRKTLLAHEIGT